MTTASISRGGTSVTLPLRDASGGTPLINRDIGKPNLNVQETGGVNPRFIDQWSGLEQYTLSGRFDSSSAYSDAVTLADLVKANPNGTALTLDINLSDYDSDMSVVAAAGQESACSFTYPVGMRDTVLVNCAFTRISETAGGGDQGVSTPTTAGSGPVQITDGSTTVDFQDEIRVERSVGRHQDTVRRTSASRHPIHYAQFKTAYDEFEIAFQVTSSTVSTVNDLVDLFAQQLGRSALTLDFNGVYGLGAFNVVPSGSQGLRHTRESAVQGMALIPRVRLRRVA